MILLRRRPTALDSTQSSGETTWRGRRAGAAWDGRTRSWHEHVTDTPGFLAVREALLAHATPQPGDAAVDLGAGTGFITIPLAHRASRVLAVDVSKEMLKELQARARRRGVRPDVMQADLARLDLPPESCDLVVSNYALHHLSDTDKGELVRRVATWLRPGGRFVVADLMLGRGTSRRDRQVAVAKARHLLRRGPGGIWRIIKNVARFVLRVGAEQPISPEAWRSLLSSAGLAQLRIESVVEEAAVVSGVKPTAASDQPSGRRP